MGKNLLVSKERVLKAAGNNECARKILEDLFPEAFEDEKIVCKIGSLFARRSTSSIYAVVALDDLVTIINVTSNYAWSKERRFRVDSVSHPEEKVLTVGEFKKLSGYDDLSDFVFDVKLADRK